jgi:hypothetical protein
LEIRGRPTRLWFQPLQVKQQELTVKVRMMVMALLMKMRWGIEFAAYSVSILISQKIKGQNQKREGSLTAAEFAGTIFPDPDITHPLGTAAILVDVAATV